MVFWGGLAAPAATPRAVIDLLNRHVAEGLADTALRARFAGAGLNPASSKPEQFGRRIADDLGWLSTAVREADLKFD